MCGSYTRPYYLSLITNDSRLIGVYLIICVRRLSLSIIIGNSFNMKGCLEDIVFKYISSQTYSVPSMLIIDGKFVEREEDVQPELISYFANIRKTAASSASSRYDFRAFLGPSCLKSMVLNFVSEFEVARILNTLKRTLSSELEKILQGISVPFCQQICHH